MPSHHMRATKQSTLTSLGSDSAGDPRPIGLASTFPLSATAYARANPVAFVPVPHALISRRQALQAALHCSQDTASYQSVIGTYLQSKHRSAAAHTSKRAFGQYAYSRTDIRLYIHIMKKLEDLSAMSMPACHQSALPGFWQSTPSKDSSSTHFTPATSVCEPLWVAFQLVADCSCPEWTIGA